MTSKAQNHNQGKPRWSRLLKDFGPELEEVLKVRSYGEQKYARMNWAESLGEECHEEFVEDTLDSLLRHVLAAQKGYKKDEESGCYHLAHAALRAMIALRYALYSEPCSSDQKHMSSAKDVGNGSMSLTSQSI